MLGSQKQIKWANEIRDGKLADFAKLEERAKNEIGQKAIAYVRDNEQASFWIDYRAVSASDMVRNLVTTGLQIRGYGFSHNATMNHRSGEIIVSWEEIVQDGRGGHKEKRTEVVA